MASTVRDVVNQQPLRGRADVMGRLLESMRYTLRTGRGGAAVVTGSVGLGKSMLIGAAAGEAARLGFTVGCARADSADADWPLAPLLCALRTGTAPVLSAGTMQDLAQRHLRGLWLVDALAEALTERAAEAPVLLALDDVDQADPLTQLALRQLPGRLAALPVMWLLAGRSVPPGIGGTGRADSGGAGVLVELGPLSGEAIEQLATDRLNRALDEELRTTLRAAQGNPRLAVALLANPPEASGLDGDSPVGAGSEPAPVLSERLLADVRAMLSPLPPEALSLLRAGAVLGTCFTATGAASLLSQTVEVAVLPGVEPLVREGLLTDDGTSLAFRHELVRHAVYADVPPTLRRAMHRAAAQHLASSADGVIEAAGHLLVSADPGDPNTVELLQRAAVAALDADPSRAAQFALAAFRLLDTVDSAQRMDAGRHAVRALARAGRPAEAVAVAEQLSATEPVPVQMCAGRGADSGGASADVLPARGISDDDTGAQGGAAALSLEAELIEPLWQLGRLDELRIGAQRRLTDASLPAAIRPLLLAQFALGSSRATDQAPGRAAAVAALAGRRYPDLPSARPLALLALGEFDRAAGHHAAALNRFRARRHSVGLHCVADEIGTLFELDRFADASALIERVEAALDARPDTGLRTVAAWARARYSFGRGDLEAAHCAAAAVPANEPGVPETWYAADARLISIEVALSRGDPAAARAALRATREARDAVTDPTGDDGSWEARLLLLEGRIASEGGGAAVALIQKAVAAAAGVRLRWSADWTAEAARSAVRGGDLLLAEQISVLAEETAARNPGVPTAKGVARLIRGMITADAAVLAEAVGELRRGPRRVDLAHALADCGTVLLDAGDRTGGISMLDEAGALLMETGAVSGLLRIQARLRAAGVRRRWATAPARPEYGWAALTEAEQKVARRVADGLSNKAIAADLYISANTVSTHLRAVFAKLGVNSRAQMTRVALTSAHEAPSHVNR